MFSKFNSINSIVDYLREPIAPSAAAKDSRNHANDGLKMSKKQRKTKAASKSFADTTHTPPHPLPQMQHNANIEVLPKGRMRYGPITVNPRKLPSKTLFTGRRSKYEVLSTDEEERRRDRRERNRIAATKCREKRETVLSQLENQHQDELESHRDLLKTVRDLEQQKKYLENILNNHLNECPLLNPSFSMVFGDTSFLSTIIDAPPPLLPSDSVPIVNSEDDELSHILVPSPALTNSAYETDESNQIFLPPLGGLPVQPIAMTSSSIERLINSLHTPNISMESSNNHSMLINTAFGSTCAQQHSHSSDDDSLPSRANPCVY